LLQRMSRRLWPTLIALLAAVSLLAASNPARAAGADAASVTGVVDRLLDAWNKRDAASFSALFSEDGDFIETRGGRIHGRSNIQAAVAKLFKQAKAENHAARGQTDVKMVKPDVALILARLSITSGKSAPGGALATAVLVSAGGKWRISALEVATGVPAASGKR